MSVADPATRPELRLAAPSNEPWSPREDEWLDVRLTYRQLVLIHRSLQAMRTLGLYPLQDEDMLDTTELVDRALKRAVWSARGTHRLVT
jgi:hypothetical protein